MPNSGMRNTVMAPAATSTLAVSCGMAPELTATDVTATMMGSAVVQYSATVKRLCVEISRVSLPVESAMKMGLKNVFFVSLDADRIDEFFADDEIDLLYINFCDPWPRKRTPSGG